MDTITQINIKNVNADQWDRLLRRFPFSPSLVVRALVAHALELSDADYLKIINKQANIEKQQKEAQS